MSGSAGSEQSNARARGLQPTGTTLKPDFIPPKKPPLRFNFFQTDWNALYPQVYDASNHEQNVINFVKTICSVEEFSELSTLQIFLSDKEDRPGWLSKAGPTESQEGVDQTGINFEDLLDGFKDILRQNNHYFDFSLVSSNHSHNLPVAFSFYAFTNAIKHSYPAEDAGKYKRIVINFDHHPDHGGQRFRDQDLMNPPPVKKGEKIVPQIIKSSGWGSALLNKSGQKYYPNGVPKEDFTSIADQYVSIGVHGTKVLREAHAATPFKAATPEKKGPLAQFLGASSAPELPIQDITKFQDVWIKIKKQAKICVNDKVLVYITWDRDVGSDGYTNWRLDEPLNRKLVIKSICNCIESICTDNGFVVGFDVTGLPDNYDKEKKYNVYDYIFKNKEVMLNKNARQKYGIVPHENDTDSCEKIKNYYNKMTKDISQVLRTLQKHNCFSGKKENNPKKPEP